MNKVVHIDGSLGEGGGQILRTALTLSILTGKALRLDNIRAGRRKPGLLRQHLTCVEAARQVSRAEVSGNVLGSTSICFTPRGVTAGRYELDIGTAGSSTLVLQTILLPLLFAESNSVVVVKGGTHNAMAPSAEYLQHVFLPLVRKAGGNVGISLDEVGFYPRGGGQLTLSVDPLEVLAPLDLLERGELLSVEPSILNANIPLEVVEREQHAIAAALDVSTDEVVIENINNAKSTGNCVAIVVRYANVTEQFSALAERGLSAQRVVAKMMNSYFRYQAESAAAGEYLADQLLLLLAIAGAGQFTTTLVSEHTRTNIATIQKFLDVEFDIGSSDAGHLIKVV